MPSFSWSCHGIYILNSICFFIFIYLYLFIYLFIYLFFEQIDGQHVNMNPIKSNLIKEYVFPTLLHEFLTKFQKFINLIVIIHFFNVHQLLGLLLNTCCLMKNIPVWCYLFDQNQGWICVFHWTRVYLKICTFVLYLHWWFKE